MPRRVGTQRADWTAAAPSPTELQREEGSSEKLEFKRPAAAKAKIKEPLKPAACSIFGVASSSGGGSGSTDEVSSGGGGGGGGGAIIKAKSTNAQPLMQQEEKTV